MPKPCINLDPNLIKKNSLYMAPISKKDFLDKIYNVVENNKEVYDAYVDGENDDIWRYVTALIESQIEGSRVYFDLCKYDFSTENLDTSDITEESTVWYGIKELYNTVFLACESGGDWEYPLKLMIYWDGYELRGYIPKYGNPYDIKKNAAFGNDSTMSLLEEMYNYLDGKVKMEFLGSYNCFTVDEYCYEDVKQSYTSKRKADPEKDISYVITGELYKQISTKVEERIKDKKAHWFDNIVLNEIIFGKIDAQTYCGILSVYEEYKNYAEISDYWDICFYNRNWLYVPLERDKAAMMIPTLWYAEPSLFDSIGDKE